MTKKALPKSIRKFIRKEKARIRREVFDLKEQERLINQLYEKFYKETKTEKEHLKEQEIKKELKKENKLALAEKNN